MSSANIEQANGVLVRPTQIRALRAAGKSLNAILGEIFGYRGGAAFAAVKAALGDTTAKGADTGWYRYLGSSITAAQDQLLVRCGELCAMARYHSPGAGESGRLPSLPVKLFEQSAR